MCTIFFGGAYLMFLMFLTVSLPLARDKDFFLPKIERNSVFN